jgi:membrane fusion protein (multidrug efflux system)
MKKMIALLIALFFWNAAVVHGEDATTQPVASVKTAPIRIGEIAETITAYGNVTAQPGEVAIISMPIESRVHHLPVTAGEQVDKDSVLIEVEPSPDSQLQLLEAEHAFDAATLDLKQAKQRFDLKLATNQDLQQSQQNLQTAQVRFENLKKRGADAEQKKITADKPGLVSKIDVQEGQIVPAGAPMLELVSQDRIEIKLGIEPSDVSHLKSDQPVKLTLVGDAVTDSLNGKIRLITQRLNPDTRLVDCFIALQSHDSLLLDAFVQAELTTQSKRTMIVPRSAVLPDDDSLTLFTVKEGHAVKHTIKLGLQNDSDVEIIGEGLNAGDVAVIVGNLELEDGMAVAPEPSP